MSASEAVNGAPVGSQTHAGVLVWGMKDATHVLTGIEAARSGFFVIRACAVDVEHRFSVHVFPPRDWQEE